MVILISGRHEEESLEFTWDEYLDLTGATPVPHDGFQHVSTFTEANVSFDYYVSPGLDVLLKTDRSDSSAPLVSTTHFTSIVSEKWC